MALHAGCHEAVKREQQRTTVARDCAAARAFGLLPATQQLVRSREPISRAVILWPTQVASRPQLPQPEPAGFDGQGQMPQAVTFASAQSSWGGLCHHRCEATPVLQAKADSMGRHEPPSSLKRGQPGSQLHGQPQTHRRPPRALCPQTCCT